MVGPEKGNFEFWRVLESHSQKSATFTVTSVTGVLTTQHHIKVGNKYLKN